MIFWKRWEIGASLCLSVYLVVCKNQRSNQQQIGCIMETSRVVFFLFILLPPNSLASSVLSRKCVHRSSFPLRVKLRPFARNKNFSPLPLLQPGRQKGARGLKFAKRQHQQTLPRTRNTEKKAIRTKGNNQTPSRRRRSNFELPKGGNSFFFFLGGGGWRKLLIVFGKNGRKKMGWCRGLRKEEVNLERI